MKNLLSSICILLFLSACSKSDEPPGTDLFVSNGVLIANEGNFQWGNASLSYYDIENNQVHNNLFQAVNNRLLGDVFQSITLHENLAFLVLNNSGRIEVVAKNTFKSIASIPGFTSPRYLQIVNQTKGYVSDLYANKIAVLDLVNYEITRFIEIPGWVEEMCLINQHVFALNKTNNRVCVINSATDQLEDSYPFDFSVSSLKKDLFNRLWIAGESNGIGKVQCLNAETFELIHSYDFEGETPSNLAISSSGSDVYFLSNGVWHINEFSDESLTVPFIPAESKLFYGLSVHEDKIYIADAINYVQQGTVWVYHNDARFVHEFEVGIIPSEFYFFNQ
jgi:hypothetical protein